MIKNKRNLLFLSIVFLFSIDSDADKNLESLMSVLYSQTSGEIKATFVQTYNTATELLDKAISDEDWDAVLESEGKINRTPAIILDVDETVLDNTPFNARSIMSNTNYPEGWDVWIYEEKATLIPGVRDFLVRAQNKGVRIFYVTNRRTVYEEATKNNIIGLIIGFLGTFLLILFSGSSGGFTADVFGLFVVAATLLYGINLNLVKYHLKHLKPIAITSFSIVSILPITLYILFFLSPFHDHLNNFDFYKVELGYVLILGVLGTSIATIIFYNLIKIKDTVFASMVTYLMPLVAISLGVIDGEKINEVQLFGMALILIGVFINGKKN